MAIVDFNSATWGDPWVRKLPKNAKILFLYLWTNNHKNLIAMYPIDPETISFETGLTLKEVLSALEILKPKVLYDPKTYFVWVVNHVRHQFMRGEMSPKIVIGIKKCLLTIKHPFAGKFLTVYKDIKEIQTLTDRVSIGYLDSGYPTSVGVGVGGGEGEGEGEGKDFTEIEKIKSGAVDEFIETKREIKKAYGEFKNVLLTGEEHGKLLERFAENGTRERIEALSSYVASKGVKYKSHYATILAWEGKNKPNKEDSCDIEKEDPRVKRILERDKKTGSGV